LIIGFLAQFIISLMKYENEELRHVAPKFIKTSLMNLTVTVEFLPKGGKREIFSNFDPINERILIQCGAPT